MTKIKLSPKSSAETENYLSFKGVDYDNAVVEAEVFERKGLQGAYILGEELLCVGVKVIVSNLITNLFMQILKLRRINI